MLSLSLSLMYYLFKVNTTLSPATTSPVFLLRLLISSMFEITTGVNTDFAFALKVSKSNLITGSPTLTL